MAKAIVQASKQLAAEAESAQNESSVLAIMSEAPIVLAVFESSVLAAMAEMGDNISNNDLVFTAPESSFWIYTVGDDVKTCTATAKIDIGEFKKGGTLVSKYDSGKDGFLHSSSQQEVAQKTIPRFFVAN